MLAKILRTTSAFQEISHRASVHLKGHGVLSLLCLLRVMLFALSGALVGLACLFSLFSSCLHLSFHSTSRSSEHWKDCKKLHRLPTQRCVTIIRGERRVDRKESSSSFGSFIHILTLLSQVRGGEEGKTDRD